MGTVTLLIVAASAIGACVASVRLVRIYNQRPIWNRGQPAEKPARKKASQELQELSFSGAKKRDACQRQTNSRHFDE